MGTDKTLDKKEKLIKKICRGWMEQQDDFVFTYERDEIEKTLDYDLDDLSKKDNFLWHEYDAFVDKYLEPFMNEYEEFEDYEQFIANELWDLMIELDKHECIVL